MKDTFGFLKESSINKTNMTPKPHRDVTHSPGVSSDGRRLIWKCFGTDMAVLVEAEREREKPKSPCVHPTDQQPRWTN